MPICMIANSDLEYYLLVFDARSKERREPDGTFMSETLRHRVADALNPVTDLFFICHGWLGDVPGSIEQYDKWVAAVANVQSDRAAVRERCPGFAPLIVGLHWPSLPWGDGRTRTEGRAVLLEGDELEVQVDAYATRIADTPTARAAIRSILESAHQDPGATTLSPATLKTYATLFAESGLGSGDTSGRPGSDQDGFDPAAIISEAQRDDGGEAASSGILGVLGFGDNLRNALLSPLRQISFWKMKDRARQFGETSGHELLTRLQLAAPNARFHLMGHSFGCIAVSAAVAGESKLTPLPRPVDSLFLVQGALSVWAYADDIPYAPGTPGYFNPIVKQRLVRGPIVTTRSSHDTAVGRWYPRGAQLKKQFLLGEEYPVYGGVGTFGIRGFIDVKDTAMEPATYAYDFSEAAVYNLEASGVIKNGGGFSGAHCDIAHPEVAHAFWAAVLASESMTSVTKSLQRSPQKRGSQTRQWGLLSPRGFISDGGASPLKPLPQSPERWINAELEDYPPDGPLATGQWYTLAFGVDITRHSAAVGSIILVPDEGLFPKGIEEVTLTVQIDTEDFEISDRTRPLRLPRLGKSHTKARFEISPRHDGPSTLKATIHKGGNFIDHMELRFEVGASQATCVEITARGRPPSAVISMNSRDVGLLISPNAQGYYCVVWGAVSKHALLPITAQLLASAIDTARLELEKVIRYRDEVGEYVFQTGIDIPESARDFALKTMARAGALLYKKLFFGPGAAADSHAVGEFLCNMASHGATLKIQILAESTPVPWGLLYLGDASSGAQLDWNNFVGMRHLIEQIPLANIPTVSDCVIASDKPQLAVSVNVNDKIDTQMGADFAAQQRSFWAGAMAARKRIRVTARSTGAEIVHALADSTTDDQILYFYCHASSKGLTNPGGPDASCLILTDGNITLGDLDLDAPTTTQLRGNPLVFINACDSAEMSPAFYDGFVPYFMAKGARGVIGTECETPGLFAAAWAKRFFERFLDGEPLCETFLALRREFLDKHRNPLGLLYAVHCDGDTQIQPALTCV